MKVFCEECGIEIPIDEAEECPVCGKTLCYDCMCEHESLHDDEDD